MREDYGVQGGEKWLSQLFHLPPSNDASWLHTCCCGWARRFFDLVRMGRSVAAHNARCSARVKARKGKR